MASGDRSFMEREATTTVYSSYSHVYDRIFGPFFAKRARQAIRARNLRQGDRVLEVGIGTGLSLPFWPPFVKVDGIDVNEDMLARARAKIGRMGLANVETAIMDALAMDYPDATFDYVFAFFVVTVVEDPCRLVREMLRVVKPDGQVVIVNHFRADRGLFGFLEGALSPLFVNLGWRSDLRVGDITSGAGARVLENRRMGRLDLWSLVRLAPGGNGR